VLGCGKLTRRTRCAAHQAEWRRERQRQGRTGQRGTSSKWRTARQLALERDRGRCTACGMNELELRRYGLKLHVHHVNGNPRDDRLANLRTVCEVCHRQLTSA